MSQRQHQFDPDTGQVYEERQVAAALLSRRTIRHGQDWHRYTAQPDDLQSSKGHRIKTLKTMSLNVFRNSVGLIENDTLQHVPDHLLWELWVYINYTRKALPFQAWKVFIKTLTERQEPDPDVEPLILRSFHHEIVCPTGSLDIYLRPMTSPAPFSFVTHLTIAGGAIFAASELFVLPKVGNLAVLEIVQPQDEEQATNFPRITDSVVREWSLAVDPFPALRILRIWGEYFTTYKSIAYITKFPLLGIYDVAGRSEDWKLNKAYHAAWERIYHESREEQRRSPRFNALGRLGNSGGGFTEWQPGRDCWARLAYAELDKLRADQASQGQSEHHHYTEMAATSVPPVLPYASITLGNGKTCHDFGENRRMTFLRSNPWTTAAAATMPQKRPGDVHKENRRLKATKRQGVDDLFSQFMAE